MKDLFTHSRLLVNFRLSSSLRAVGIKLLAALERAWKRSVQIASRRDW